MHSAKRYPKWDQNLQFTPQNETTSIPVTFIWESPRGKVRELYEMNGGGEEWRNINSVRHSSFIVDLSP